MRSEIISSAGLLPRTLRLIWAAARGWTVAWVALLFLQGMLPAVPVYLSRLLVDGLVHAVRSGGSRAAVQPLLLLAGLLAAALLAAELLKSVLDWVRASQSALVEDHINELVQEQSSVIDLAFYESPEYYDHLHRARDDAGSRSLALLENLGTLLRSTTTLLAMAAVLLPYGWWLPAVLLLSSCPAFLFMVRLDTLYHGWWQRTTAARRWAGYYELMLSDNDAAAEIRLFGLARPFQAAYRRLRQQLRKERLRFIGKQSLVRFLASIFSLFISALMMGWMVWKAIRGLATLGDLTLFYQALQRSQQLLQALLGSLGKIYTSTLFLRNLFEFLDLQRRITDPPRPRPIPSPLREGISFSRVSFGYPGSDRMALDDFSLFFPAGQITAVVGPNGAGKSTLVKLLCRFYDPRAGHIALDGVRINHLRLGDLHQFITVLFQLPVPYHATAAHNISFGDAAAAAGHSAVERAARTAGAHDFIKHLPAGYDTLLGKWFRDGTDLSVGEWQRIALARAFLRQAQIIVLDEPTSFMDPWSEADWFERFRRLASERTAIIITHRFSLARHADTIHVMDRGRIVESGSHGELASRHGLYAQCWHSQVPCQAASEEWTGPAGRVAAEAI